eukprot:TRINITY_DN52643_c0_g1_i1.p2 TRINITY_DN52643_c0_g1~~TRINITY_DN52643_c0_g1_i1.p2  ORF type:complete len:161 (+),score=33.34 TRINITY_DN52643_c0_g1_i1:42-524(+)
MCFICLCFVSCLLVFRMSRQYSYFCVFFFQAEDGIRDAQESRGLGDVYKRQDELTEARMMLKTMSGNLRDMMGQQRRQQRPGSAGEAGGTKIKMDPAGRDHETTIRDLTAKLEESARWREQLQHEKATLEQRLAEGTSAGSGSSGAVSYTHLTLPTKRIV